MLLYSLAGRFTNAPVANVSILLEHLQREFTETAWTNPLHACVVEIFLTSTAFFPGMFMELGLCEVHVFFNYILESEHVAYISCTITILPADPTPAGPLSTAAIIGITAPGTVVLVVVLFFLVVTILLVKKHSHFKQTTEDIYDEIPGMKEPNEAYETNTPRLVAYIPVAKRVRTIQNKAYGSVSGAAVNSDTEEPVDVEGISDAIGMKELNKAYGTNSHIATTANDAYGRVKGIPVAEIVAYMPVAERVLAFQNQAYGSVSGAAVNTDTEEEDDVYEMYEIRDAIGMKEPSKACGTNAPTASNDAYGRVKGIPVAENVPYMPVAERVQNKAYGSVSGAAVNTDTEEQIGVDEIYD